jgi:hypothetical protein
MAASPFTSTTIAECGQCSRLGITMLRPLPAPVGATTRQCACESSWIGAPRGADACAEACPRKPAAARDAGNGQPNKMPDIAHPFSCRCAAMDAAKSRSIVNEPTAASNHVGDFRWWGLAACPPRDAVGGVACGQWRSSLWMSEGYVPVAPQKFSLTHPFAGPAVLWTAIGVSPDS